MSIAKKVTLVVSLLAGLMLVGSGYTLMGYRQGQRQEQMRAEVWVLVQVIRMAVESSLGDYGQMGAIEDLVSRTRPIQVTFFGADGRAIAPVPPEEEPVVDSRARRVVESNREDEEVRDGWFVFRAPLHLPDSRDVVGVVELRADLGAFERADWAPQVMLVAGALFLVFALAVGMYSRQAIQRPVAQLMDGMDHIIQGDLTWALPLDRNDEIGNIAYRFNEMTAQLRDAQEEIRRSVEARLQLEQRVRQSEKLATVGQLSAEIAHEVGTPLNVIGGRARSLRRKAHQPEEVEKNATIIAEQAARITKIIQQMLDLSRARIMRRISVDLARILDDVLSLMEFQLDHRGITLLRPPAPLPFPPVNGDADGLQQVFINLVNNAVQAMPRGGTLSVGLRVEHRRKGGLDLAPPQEYLVVSVADTGEGIPEALRAKIFDPFFSTKGPGEGTGLGLTVAGGIVKEHDGWIEVGDCEPHGAELRVYLPAATEEEG